MTTSTTVRKLSPAQQRVIDAMSNGAELTRKWYASWYLTAQRLPYNTARALLKRDLIQRTDCVTVFGELYTLTDAGAALATKPTDTITTLAIERENLLRRYADLTPAEHARLNQIDDELDNHDWREVMEAVHTAAKTTVSDLAAEITGYMRPCETCGGTGTVPNGDYVKHCPDCDGTGIYAPDADDE